MSDFVKFTGFKVDWPGMNEALSGPEAQEAVNEQAKRICADANAMARENSVHRHEPGGLVKDAYMANEGEGSKRAVANVATANPVGRWDNSTNHTLLKAMNRR